jgi:hypothetical protein
LNSTWKTANLFTNLFTSKISCSQALCVKFMRYNKPLFNAIGKLCTGEFVSKMFNFKPYYHKITSMNLLFLKKFRKRSLVFKFPQRNLLGCFTSADERWNFLHENSCFAKFFLFCSQIKLGSNTPIFLFLAKIMLTLSEIFFTET